MQDSQQLLYIWLHTEREDGSEHLVVVAGLFPGCFTHLISFLLIHHGGHSGLPIARMRLFDSPSRPHINHLAIPQNESRSSISFRLILVPLAQTRLPFVAGMDYQIRRNKAHQHGLLVVRACSRRPEKREG